MRKKKQDNTERLQKLIANAGLASRREAEEWIQDGLVKVNGKPAALGDKADPQNDSIRVRGKLLKKEAPSSFVFALNKPRGFICSNRDPHNSDTIFQLLPKGLQKQKLFCAGRLDKDSEGLVIITNDGKLAQKITHPSHETVKRYQVLLSKDFDTKLIPVILKGIRDKGELLQAHKIIIKKSGPQATRRLEVHLTQGHKREIRRIFQHFSYFVERLQRFQIGKLTLKGITPGKHKQLTKKDIEAILS